MLGYPPLKLEQEANFWFSIREINENRESGIMNHVSSLHPWLSSKNKTLLSRYCARLVFIIIILNKLILT